MTSSNPSGLTLLKIETPSLSMCHVVMMWKPQIVPARNAILKYERLFNPQNERETISRVSLVLTQSQLFVLTGLEFWRPEPLLL